MEHRTLGTNGPAVSAIGYGAMVLSPDIYGQVDDDDSIRTLHAAIERGVTLIDTARLYGDGHNEALIGRALDGRRDGVILATKGGLTGNPPDIQVDGSPAGLRRDLEASLTALGVDHIDLYYLHAPDPDVDVESSYGTMATFVQDGTVRHLGVSNMALEDIRRCHAMHPISASQDQYSLLWREPEDDGRLDLLDELGIALVAYSPLANGILAGAKPGVEAGDMRSWMPRFAGDAGSRVAQVADAFTDIAAREGVHPATLALAWLLHQRPNLVPIAGTRKVANLDNNVAAVDLDLSADLLAELDRTFSPEESIAPMF
ncbi:aldo/keto reductase [Euzebya tangerina]|uniref:aldo/keto reductase n=1 Tax=Euzebya tangerina TaxID=591198 RepID=UPI000E319EAB|nr:aldo/keto reductase [Euzebya tangerina]